MVTLYEYTRQPRYWIVHDEDGYWLVPARNGGWHERVPFVGHATALRPVKDREGIDLGMPRIDPAMPAGSGDDANQGGATSRD